MEDGKADIILKAKGAVCTLLAEEKHSVRYTLGTQAHSTTLNMYGHTFDDRMRGVMDMMEDN